MNVVDDLLVRLSNSVFGDLSRHGNCETKNRSSLPQGKNLSHPKISILGCEYLFEYNYSSSEYFENFLDLSSNYSHFL
jgi:hypothetical protein